MDTRLFVKVMFERMVISTISYMVAVLSTTFSAISQIGWNMYCSNLFIGLAVWSAFIFVLTLLEMFMLYRFLDRRNILVIVYTILIFIVLYGWYNLHLVFPFFVNPVWWSFILFSVVFYCSYEIANKWDF